MNTTTVKKVGQVYITGTVFDASTNQPLFGVTVTLLDQNNNPVATPTTLAAGSNTFTVWTETPDQRRVAIDHDGYAPTVMEFTYLQNNTEVFLQPLTETPTAGTTDKKYWLIALLALPLLMKRKKQVGKLTQDDIKWVLLGVGGLFAFKFIRDLLARFGLVEGQGATEVNQQLQDPNSAFKPTYYHQFTSFTYALTTTQAQEYAATIHGAFGVFQDDFNAVYGVFSNMRTKSNVSFLAEVFQEKYNEDLLTFLTDGGGILPWDGLSDAHLKQIMTLVSNLPTH